MSAEKTKGIKKVVNLVVLVHVVFSISWLGLDWIWPECMDFTDDPIYEEKFRVMKLEVRVLELDDLIVLVNFTNYVVWCHTNHHALN